MAPTYGPQKPDSELLREQVRTRIDSGALPQVAPARLLAGYGENQPCALCGQPITPTQVEYDVELNYGAERKTLHFHLACHAAWQLEISDPGTP
jgi:hypothetical protein